MKNLFSAALLLATGLLSTSCYTLSEGWQLISIYSQAKPFDKTLQDPHLSPEERTLIETSMKIKTYAVERLGLRQNQNYTNFVKTDRKYLSNVVSAAASDSFTQYFWDFPFVGKLPYQGYFERKDADEEVARLKKEGWDVMMRPVDAFSTLGFFSDPLFSYMADYNEGQLADLLIHEQTHATIFLDGQANFNENLAVFIGGEGSLLYLKEKYGPDSQQVKDLLNTRADMNQFRKKLHDLDVLLDAVYTDKSLTKELKLQRKTEVIATFQKQFAVDYAKDFKTPNWKGFSEISINNAYLMTFRNYLSGLDDFDSFYKGHGSDLVKCIEVFRSMPKNEKDPLGWMKEH